jgi:hypothetical protein
MTDRERGEGNTDAAKVDEREVRADGNQESGPRRVEEARRDRGTGHGSAYASTGAERAG